MKLAFLMMGELRIIKNKIESLYKNIFDYYDADIFILVQKVSNKDYEDIKLLNRRVVYQEIYEKPSSSDYFRDSNIHKYKNDNWNKESCIQYYINMRKMQKVIEAHIDKYDYFITSRIDIEILFPLPSKNLIESIQKPLLFTFDPEYSRGWGGYGVCFLIHKKFILKYLNEPFNVIKDKKKLNMFFEKKKRKLNQENFLNFCYEELQFPIKKIREISSYYTCDSLNSYTTYSKPLIHPIHKVICKYEGQCSEVYNNNELWKKGYRWAFENDVIFLKRT